MCYYCHWGWPEKVAKIYQEALEELGGNETALNYGPGHIVWEDCNFESARWCLKHFDEYLTNVEAWEMPIVRRSLERMAALPEEEWDIIPADCDFDRVGDYPPTGPVIKI